MSKPVFNGGLRLANNRAPRETFQIAFEMERELACRYHVSLPARHANKTKANGHRIGDASSRIAKLPGFAVKQTPAPFQSRRMKIAGNPYKTPQKK
ncbi:hypothetical protein FAZ69_13835 [Trinickia terrae]|uniref:Uncharacterized protein n=1 Tax=Trinickia terrae TaxID=2571161 RepID=A0A4U1I6C1_9BURK|nr:hypothetical protein [Trinickia terrae]TKC88817.1 hypothetical protein FAZ69_13835 [Trinickia terrae]